MGSKIYGEILEDIGGKKNVKSIEYDKDCLIINYIKETDVKFSRLASNDEIIRFYVENNKRIIIEMKDDDSSYESYKYINRILNELNEKNKVSFLMDKVFSFIASVFEPIVPGLAGSGILKGVLLLFVQIGFMNEESGLFLILNIASNAIFYFLPIVLAFSTARVLNVNPFIAALIPLTLLHPDFVSLVNQITVYEILNIPMILINYSSTVLPIIFSIVLYSIMYNFLNERIPISLKNIVLPLATLVLIVPVTVMIIGPMGYFGGDILAQFVSVLSIKNGTLTGLLIGGLWVIIIMMGLNWAVNPIMLNNLSLYGFDFIRPLTFAANFSTLGVVIGLFLSTKIKDTKNFAATNIFSVSVSGIIDPTIYGILIKDRRYFVAQIIGGAIGGAYLGFREVVSNAFVFGSLITLPALVTEQSSNLIHGLTGLLISTSISAILSFIITKVIERN